MYSGLSDRYELVCRIDIKLSVSESALRVSHFISYLFTMGRGVVANYIYYITSYILLASKVRRSEKWWSRRLTVRTP